MDTPSRFPLFVDLTCARCLVVGAGSVGRRRAKALACHGAWVTVVDPKAAAGQADEAAPGRIDVKARTYRLGDEGGCRLVVAATNDRAVNLLVGQRCRAAGIPVSVADAPGECTFFFPALCEGAGLTVGVVSRTGDHRLVARAARAIRSLLADLDRRA